MLEIEYECEHLTCRMSCHTGKLVIGEQRLKDLADTLDPKMFRSPSKTCKIGFIQQFKIISKKEIQEVKKEEIKEEEILEKNSALEERVLKLEERITVLEEQVSQLSSAPLGKKRRKNEM